MQLHLSMMNGSYSTTSNSYEQSTVFRVIQTLLLILFMVAGIIGNLYVCVFMSRIRELRTRTNTFYVSLCIANIGMTVTSVPFTLISAFAGEWTLGTVLCRVNGIVNPFWITASCFSVTATTIHKYLSIVYPMKHHLTGRKAYMMIFAVWLTSAVVTIWPITQAEHIRYKPLAGHCGYSLSDHQNETFYLITLACVVFFCPTFINTYCYVLIFRVLNRHRLRIERTTTIDAGGVKTQRRNIVTLLVIFVVFFVTWLPFNVFSLLFATNRQDLIPYWLLALAYICAYSTCVQIPLVIIYRSSKLRNGIKHLLSSVFCKACVGASADLHILNSSSDPYGAKRRSLIWHTTSERPPLEVDNEPRTETVTTWSYTIGCRVFDESKLWHCERWLFYFFFPWEIRTNESDFVEQGSKDLSTLFLDFGYYLDHHVRTIQLFECYKMPDVCSTSEAEMRSN